MSTTSIAIIVVCALACVWVLAKAGAFKFIKKLFHKKSKTAKKQSKIEQKTPTPAEKSKEPDKKDRGFVISKKGRLARVSTSAISADARTAKIEKVFERTPQETKKVIEVDQSLTPQDEDLLEAISKIQSDERKVVSLAELKKQSKDLCPIEQEELATSKRKKQSEDFCPIEQEELAEEKENLKPVGSTGRYSFEGRSSIITGDYSGFGVGSVAEKEAKILPEAEETKSQNTDDDPFAERTATPSANKFQRFFNRDIFSGRPDMDFPGFGPAFSRNQEALQQSEGSKDLDFSDAVEAEVMLHPKCKTNKENKK